MLSLQNRSVRDSRCASPKPRSTAVIVCVYFLKEAPRATQKLPLPYHHVFIIVGVRDATREDRPELVHDGQVGGAEDQQAKRPGGFHPRNNVLYVRQHREGMYASMYVRTRLCCRCVTQLIYSFGFLSQPSAMGWRTLFRVFATVICNGTETMKASTRGSLGLVLDEHAVYRYSSTQNRRCFTLHSPYFATTRSTVLVSCV